MSIRKLVQTGVDNEGVFNVMDGLSFAQALNNNADELGTETKLDLEVHNTPEAIAKVLKEQTNKMGFHTPGGPDDLPTFEEEGAPVNSPSELKDGIAQIYNETLGDTTVSIAITTPPTKTTYVEGEVLDLTGMVVTATEEDGDTKIVTDYAVDLEGEELTTTDTKFIVTYNGKTAEQTITVNALAVESIEVTTPPTKTTYAAGEYFDPTGMVVTAHWNNGTSSIIEENHLTYEPNTETPLTTEDTAITITDETSHTTTQAISVQ